MKKKSLIVILILFPVWVLVLILWVHIASKHAPHGTPGAGSLWASTVHAQNGPVPPPVQSPGGMQVQPTPAPPAPEAQVQHPSDAFLADVDAYIALVGEVQALQAKLKATKEWKTYQDASDRAAGMQLRIQQQIPRGWRYDSKSRMFLPPDPPAKRPVPAGRVSPESKEETKP